MTFRPVGLLAFTISNFRGITQLHAEPNGANVTLKGKNGAGKSSGLDALWWGLGGDVSGEVVKNGAERAEVEIRFDDYLITRKKTKGKDPALKVKSADGKVTHSSPTALLVGFKNAIERRTFSARTGKDQQDIVRKLAPGLDVSDLDTEEAAVYTRRTGVNAEAKSYRVQAAAVVVPEAPETAGVEKQPKEVRERLKLAQTAVAANEKQRVQLAADEGHVEEVRGQVEALAGELERAQQKPAKAREALAAQEGERTKLAEAVEAERIARNEVERIEILLRDAREVERKAAKTCAEQQRIVAALPVLDLAALDAEPARLEREIAARRTAIETDEQALATKRAAVAALVDPDTAAIEREMDALDEHNAQVRAAQKLIDAKQAKATEKAAFVKKAEEREAASGKDTARLAEIATTRTKRIADAACPIPGLALVGDIVTYDDGKHGPVEARQGILNDGTCIRLDVLVAKELGHRLVGLRNAERLDPENRRAVETFAAEHGIQLLSEVRTDSGDVVEAVIEAGEVALPEAAAAVSVGPMTEVIITKRGAEELQARGGDAKAGDVITIAEEPAPPVAEAADAEQVKFPWEA